MKKWISTLAYAALLSPICAIAAQQAFTGFTGGVNVGVIQGETRINYEEHYIVAPAGSPGNAGIRVGNPTAKLGDFSGTAGLSLGFASCFNANFNWGVELRANFSDIKNTLDVFSGESTGIITMNSHTSLKLTQQYAAIAKLGILFNPCAQIYGIIGPQWGNFKLRSYSQTTQGVTNNAISAIKDEHTHYKAGILLGLGLEQLLNPCTSIALEYNYANYGHPNFKDSLRANFIDLNTAQASPDTYVEKNHNARFFSNSMLLKFAYYYS